MILQHLLGNTFNNPLLNLLNQQRLSKNFLRKTLLSALCLCFLAVANIPPSNAAAPNANNNSALKGETANPKSTKENPNTLKDNLNTLNNGGVILVYHHVSHKTPATTSVTPEQFKQHLNYLEENNFNVISLTDLLNAIEQKKILPARTIAMSFDDAYISVFKTAYPLLKERNWPFSVFVASHAIDRGYSHFMTWDQLRELSKYGAQIGGHTASHAHLARRENTQSQADWLKSVTQEIDLGNLRIESEIGKPVTAFAYPYGEFNTTLKELLKQRKLYGLAQHSGAVGPLTDRQAIPRYPLAQGYANIDRFKQITHSKALPVLKIIAGTRVRTAGDTTGNLILQLQKGDYQINNLACYSATGNKLTTTKNDLLITLKLPTFSPGRNKVNCTAPSASTTGVYYWFSHQWLVKTPQGLWPAE